VLPDKVICPYCNKEFDKISPFHIKMHGKTWGEMKAEFPGLPLVGSIAQKNLEEANIRKFGCKNNFQTKETKDKIKASCINKYGVEYSAQAEEVKNRMVKTNLERYGVRSTLQTDYVKEKSKETMIEKYGCDHPLKSEEIRDKMRDTMTSRYGVDNFAKKEDFGDILKGKIIEKYGVESTNQLEEVKNKKIKTCNENWGSDWGLGSKLLRDKISEKKLLEFEELLKSHTSSTCGVILNDNSYRGSKDNHLWQCSTCGNTFISKWNYIQQGISKCPTCFPREFLKSKEEDLLAEFIESMTIPIKRHDRTIIRPFELDILIENKFIGIEYCGLYWHSEKLKISDNYHLNKLDRCNNNNYRLITIFSDEWMLKQDIVKARLKHILGVKNDNIIYGRKCVIKEISSKEKKKFLEDFHIQGSDNSVIKLGAFYNNKLVSVMTFSRGSIAKGSKSEEGVWELSRFCSDYNYHIPGIASKMFMYFKKNYPWKKIFTFADRRWSDGNVYEKLGMKLTDKTKPNYWYTKNFIERIHRFSLRKRPEEPKDIPEWVLRQKEGYSRIWDCGNLKYMIEK